MLRRIIGLALVTLAVVATASAQDVKLPEIEFGRYHALVIGNNDYQHLPKLNTAVGDAAKVDNGRRQRRVHAIALAPREKSHPIRRTHIPSQ